MSYLSPSTTSLQSTERISQGPTQGAICGNSGESQRQTCSPQTVLIDILDDYSLLNIFYLYRPAIFDGDEGYFDSVQGGRAWDRERWWYKLAQVCQRWRNVLLRSASHLDLCLVCTYGTPVADMLAHSPPLPLVMDYFRRDQDISAEDEEGITHALGQHADRLRRVRLCISASKLEKLISINEEEYPVLEYVIMQPLERHKGTALMFPETLRAPRLRHIMISGFGFQIGSQLLANAAGLVTFCLHGVSILEAYFQPKTLLQWISFMPQLETLVIFFYFSVPKRDVERQLINTPIMNVTLPNLRFLVLQTGSVYAEAIIRRITTPRLQKLDIWFTHQLTFSVPYLHQFINTTANLRFDSAKFEFRRDKIYAGVYLREEIEIAQVKMIPLLIVVHCRHLDWQVSSMAQIFNSLGEIFSTVEHLTLEHKVHDLSSEEHNEVDHTEWRELLRSFSKVKTLRVGDGLVEEVSRCLRLGDGEDPLELLPELQSLTYSGIGDTDNAFTSFIDVRQSTDHPLTLVHSRPVTPEIWDW